MQGVGEKNGRLNTSIKRMVTINVKFFRHHWQSLQQRTDIYIK